MAFQEVKIMNSGEYTLTTILILVLSFVYYYYKYRRTRTVVEASNLVNNNQANNTGELNPEVQEEMRQFEQNNINRNTQTNNQEVRQENPNLIKIFTLINNSRKEHRVDLNIKVDEFIRNYLTDVYIPINKRLMLIYKGKRLDFDKRFRECQITEETVIHGFILDNTNSNSNQNEGSSSNQNSANQANQASSNISENSVSIHTIYIHVIIFLFISAFLYFSKKFPDLFPNSNNLLFGLLSIFWLTQVSNTLAKLYIYRLIVYE